MRVILVGPLDARGRLRHELASGDIDVLGEAATLATARASDVAPDAYLLAASSTGRSPDADEAFSEPLTPRETDVLALLAEGLPNKAIAARLEISDQTVKFHVASIYGKLGASNRTDAVRRALRRGIITL